MKKKPTYQMTNAELQAVIDRTYAMCRETEGNGHYQGQGRADNNDRLCLHLDRLLLLQGERAGILLVETTTD